MLSEHGPLAALALLMLFPLTMALYGTIKPAAATAFVVFGSVLFAPEHAYFKFPLLPHFTKDNLPHLMMLIALATFFPNRLFKKSPGFGPEFILYLGIFTSIITAVTNTETLRYGNWVTVTLPGLSIKDGLFIGMGDASVFALPFMVGRMLFNDAEDLRVFFKALVALMLVYTLCILIELRMSPQLNFWVYGYYAAGMIDQAIRWGGYRPTVFMEHGLAVSLIVVHACVLLAAAKRARVQLFSSLRTSHLLMGMLVVLVLCKSTGSIVYALIVVPIVLWAPMRLALGIAQTLAVITVLYPVLRSNDLVPVDTLVEWSQNIAAERAASLKFRFDNELMLLRKAQEKIWFGWGSYGRNSLYDPDSGKEMAIADGAWIIIVGRRGLIGLIMTLGVPAYAAVYAARRIPKIPKESDRWLMVGVLYMLTVGVIDLIPNGLFNTYPFFVAGALFGLAHYMTSPKALRAARAGGNVPVTGGRGKKRKRKRGPMPNPGPVPVWSPMPAYPSVDEQDQLFQQPPTGEVGWSPNTEDALFEDATSIDLNSADSEQTQSESSEASEAKTIVPGAWRIGGKDDPPPK